MLHNILLIINSYTLININEEYSDKYKYSDYYGGLQYKNICPAYNWRDIRLYNSNVYNAIYTLKDHSMRRVGTLPLCMQINDF